MYGDAHDSMDLEQQGPSQGLKGLNVKQNYEI